jgi:hypothetical protein
MELQVPDVITRHVSWLLVFRPTTSIQSPLEEYAAWKPEA